MRDARSRWAALNWGICLVLFGISVAAGQDSPLRPPRLRNYDVKHIKAELALDFARGEVAGTVTHTLLPLHPGLQKFEIDCEELTVFKVTVDKLPQAFEHKSAKLSITLDQPRDPGQAFEVAITYSGQPKRGMYFVTPSPVYPQKTPTVWTQGEPELTHFWLPCYDYPNDLATSEMVITVPENFYVLSNGQLLKVTADANAKTKTFHWKMALPHVSYLISLVVGDLVPYEMEVNGLTITSYAPRGKYDEEGMRRAYGRTGEMLKVFNRLIGVDYPWPRYAQVTVPEFRAGGMENVTATTLVDSTLRDAAATLESSPDGLIAHELAHQWWGDLLTCRDWSHLWLNEGFATYFDALYTEDQLGPAAFFYKMDGNRKSAVAVDQTKPRPVVWDRYKHPNEMFDARAYPKGACILHMLRGLLGDSAFFGGLRHYCNKHRHQNVVTADLQKALEEHSKQSLDWFFEQWLYRAGAPHLQARWKWDQADKTVRVTVRQTQKTSDLVPLFKLPTTLELLFEPGETTRYAITIQSAEQEFVIPCAKSPRLVQLDPDHYLLAKLDWQKPAAEWIVQLEQSTNVGARAEAARALAEQPASDAARTALLAAYEKEKSESLRSDVLRAIAKQSGPQVKAALVKAALDDHPLVRRTAYEELGKLSGADVVMALNTGWHAESAPQARAAALRALVKVDAAQREAVLAEAVAQPGFRAIVGRTALELLIEYKSPRARETLFLLSQNGTEEQLRAAAIANLARIAAVDPELLPTLRRALDEPPFFVQRAAVDALGEAGVEADAKLLESRLKQQSLHDGEVDQYRRAIEKIRSRKAPDPREKNLQQATALEAEAQQLELRVQRLRAEAAELRGNATSPTKK